jgi:hypothetical protein
VIQGGANERDALGSSFPGGWPIPLEMRRDRTLEKIAAAFAQAVAEGDLREAEGWLAVARLADRREPDPHHREPLARGTGTR